MARKAENLKHDYAATQKRDEFRLRGDLITANLYRMKSGEKSCMRKTTMRTAARPSTSRSTRCSPPQQNAAKNYKQYNKLKTAEFHLREQIEKAENERAYLESVLQELSQAETEQEFNEIRRELQETNYIRKSSGKKELKRAFAPRTFKTSSGLEVLVGRSNVQNDQLTKRPTSATTGSTPSTSTARTSSCAARDSRRATMICARPQCSHPTSRRRRRAATSPVDYSPREVRQKSPRGARPRHGDLRQLPHTLCHARRRACQKALSQVNYRKAIPLSPVRRQKQV